MLTGITLENFKAFKAAQFIPIKPITLIFGQNSSGKSSIVHAWAFLKHVYLTKGHCDPITVDHGWSKVHLGSWRNLVHGQTDLAKMKIGLHDESSAIHWTFGRASFDNARVESFDIKRNGEMIARGENLLQKGIQWNIQLNKAHPFWVQMRKSLRDELLSRPHSGEIAEPFNNRFSEWLGNSEWIDLPSCFYDKPLVSSLIPRHLLDPDLSVDFGDFDMWNSSCHEELDKLLDALNIGDQLSTIRQIGEVVKRCSMGRPDRTFEDSFASKLFIGANRALPEYPLRESEMPLTPETEPWRILLRNEKKYLATRQEEVSELLNSLTIKYSITSRKRKEQFFNPNSGSFDDYVVEDELVFKSTDKAETGFRPIHSLGSGIGKILPVVVALATCDEELLWIEEPECHVHPRVQSEIGDLIIARHGTYRQRSKPEILEFDDDPSPSDYIPDEIKGNVIIETHSEHLILRILRRIRETTEGNFSDWPEALREACPNGICPQDVAVLFVKPGTEGSEVIELPVDANGEFTCDWPGGFFEERLKEFF